MNPQLFHDLAASEEASGYFDNARALRAVPDLVTALEQCITGENATCYAHLEYMQRRLESISAIARAALAALHATDTTR